MGIGFAVINVPFSSYGYSALYRALPLWGYWTPRRLNYPVYCIGLRIFFDATVFPRVPDDLIHAARLDGMGEFELVWRILMPAAMPAFNCFFNFLGGLALERLFLAAPSH